MKDGIYQGLTIDGGGIKGIGPAKALMLFEQESGKPIIEQFDFIAGTSTGGIIAVLLSLGYSAEIIYQLYRDHATDIFYKPGGLWYLNPFNPTYSASRFKSLLKIYCGDATMQDVKIPIFIPSANIATNETHVFYHKHTDLLRDIILKTTAAPTYFKPINSWVDGGIWANNPALVGTLGFKRMKKCKLDQINILSLGTGCSAPPIPFDTKKMTKLHWVKPLTDFLLQGNESSTEFFMSELDVNEYTRIVPSTDTHWRMDDVDSLSVFVKLWETEFISSNDKFKLFYN